MAFNNEAALHRLEAKIDKALKKPTMIVKHAAKTVAEELVDRTPRFFPEDPESGNTRANWRLGVGGPDTSYSEGIADYEGSSTKATLRAEIQSTPVTAKTDVFITNSCPSMPFLEFGLYPNPPRVGSYNPYTGETEIRSSGGYSLQAPQGIVGVTALRWSEIISDAIARYNQP